MSSALIAAPVMLAVVLATSGIAKLRDRSGVDQAFRDMGVPALLDQRWIRTAFPYGEVALAAGLLVSGGALFVAVAGATGLLMIAYLVLVWRAWRKPDAVECHCFGAALPSRVSALTVARNVTLVALSGLAVLDALPGVPVIVRLPHGDTAPWLIALGVAVWLTYAITQPSAADSATDAVEEPSAAAAGVDTAEDLDEEDYVRTPNPGAVLIDAAGTPITLMSLTMQRPVLMLWLSFSCGSCQQVLGNLNAWREAMPVVDFRVAVTGIDQFQSAPADVRDLVLLDAEWTLGRVMNTHATPSAVLFGADGLVAGGPAIGAADIFELVEAMQESLNEAAAQQEAPAAP